MPFDTNQSAEKENLIKLATRMDKAKDVHELTDALKSYVGWHGKDADPTRHISKALTEYMKQA
jgi:hypothetical protein